MVLFMSEKLITILHVAPFFVILTLVAGSFLYQKITKNSITFDLSPTILLLTSIGIAFGFSTHQPHHHHGGFTSCYVCLGYASILALLAYNKMRATKKAVKKA